MRLTMLFIIGLLLLSNTVAAQTKLAAGASLKPVFTSTVGPCRAANLSVRFVNEDQAMGGVHMATFAFKNVSTTSCTLRGYPVFILIGRAGKMLPHGRAINSSQLPVDDAKVPVELVTVEPGKEVAFQVDFNSGGAGYMGKPCPISRRVRISAPGSARVFVLKQQLQLCSTIKVSSVRSGPIE
jgi:hypothetical protein